MNQLIVDNAVECSKLVKGDPHEYISNFTPAIFWLSELHNELRNEITPFRKLDRETKLRYWIAVNIAAPKKSKWVRVLASFACYTYDLITKKQLE